jgi:tetratricopeptide (TPR) repeat protein
MASSYDQLGRIAEEWGDYEQALDWYRQSPTVFEELGNRADMASTISQIGALYTQTGRTTDAVAYNLRSLAIRADIRSPETRIDLHWLRQQRQSLGDQEFQRLLTDHLDADSIDTVTGCLDQTND